MCIRDRHTTAGVDKALVESVGSGLEISDHGADFCREVDGPRNVQRSRYRPLPGRARSRSRPRASAARKAAMSGPQAAEARTVSASLVVSPDEATIVAKRSSLAWRAMVSYSAQRRAMLWLLAHSSVMVRVADLSALELASTCRSTSAGASSSGSWWEVARSGSYMVSTYSRLLSRPRVAMT